MESDRRDPKAIQRFLSTLSQCFRCCCWVGSDEREISLSVEEISPASSYQSSVRPYFVEEESKWYRFSLMTPGGLVLHDTGTLQSLP
ncbi:hypothetical protein SRHO_G00199290 [Serrasalmus rhombeus]